MTEHSRMTMAEAEAAFAEMEELIARESHQERVRPLVLEALTTPGSSWRSPTIPQSATSPQARRASSSPSPRI